MTSTTDTPELVIRLAGHEERASLAHLAALDSAPAPAGAVLLAEVEGEPWAALSLDDGRFVADPFRPAGELRPLLAERARQLDPRLRRRTRRGLHLPRRAALV
jgi:hypothetical protein